MNFWPKAVALQAIPDLGNHYQIFANVAGRALGSTSRKPMISQGPVPQGDMLSCLGS